MITIIHGDNPSDSRAYLLTIKSKPDTLSLSSDQMNLTDLSQIFDGTSLFDEKKSIVIEDYLSKTKKSKEKDAILTYISAKGIEHTITFWDGKVLTKSQYSGLKNPTEKIFKLPQTLFQFLDSLAPNNAKRHMELFHSSLETTEPELLFYMLVRHIRLLLAIQTDEMTIEEAKRIQSWQKTKLTSQASRFGFENLKSMHRKLFSIETDLKTGKLPSNLTVSIDFFLLSL